MASIILVSPLLVDSIPIDKSSILFIFVFSPLLELELASILVVLLVPNLVLSFLVLGSIPISLALLVPNLVPLPLLIFVVELDWDFLISKSYENSLLILAYCQAYVLDKL